MSKQDLSGLTPKQALEWELNECCTRHQCLREYIASEAFKQESPTQQAIIEKQRKLMAQYVILVQKRIPSA